MNMSKGIPKTEYGTNSTWDFCFVHHYKVLIYMPHLFMSVKVYTSIIIALEKMSLKS